MCAKTKSLDDRVKKCSHHRMTLIKGPVIQIVRKLVTLQKLFKHFREGKFLEDPGQNRNAHKYPFRLFNYKNTFPT